MVKYFEWEYLELMFSCAYVYVDHRTFIAPQQLVGLRVKMVKDSKEEYFEDLF